MLYHLIHRLRQRVARRAEQAAAAQEVQVALREDPVAGYGLYHILADAGLLTSSAQAELADLIAQVETRLRLPAEERVIKLPMAFEPITDVEHDTLTLVIGEAMAQYVASLPGTDEPQRLAGLVGLVDTLERHAGHTARLTLEVDFDAFLLRLLRHCGERELRAHRRTDRLQPGDFVQIVRPGKAPGRMATRYIKQRRIEKHEVAIVETLWPQQLIVVERLLRTAAYTRPWPFPTVNKHLSNDPTRAVIHAEEGDFFRLSPRYRSAAGRLIAAFRANAEDRSQDPGIYQPVGPRAEDADAS